MTFQPILPLGGYSGWRFLQQTQDTQRSAFDNSAQVQRDLAYFKENIGQINTASELVQDFRMLRVALGAFGLEGDQANKFFIRKVLEEGTIEPSALANKLSDTRYKDFAKAFGFGDFDTPNTKLSTFADDIADRFKERSFENAVGAVDQDMRLALNAKREIGDLAASGSSDATKWFTIMGNPPLRSVLEGALNFPSSFATLPVDRQLEEFQSRADRVFGSPSVDQFTDEGKVEDLIQRFLLNKTLQNGLQATSPAATALTLLRAINP